MALTAEQVSSLKWVSGFRDRIGGRPKPKDPDKLAGWTAADALLATKDGRGGYG